MESNFEKMQILEELKRRLNTVQHKEPTPTKDKDLGIFNHKMEIETFDKVQFLMGFKIEDNIIIRNGYQAGVTVNKEIYLSSKDYMDSISLLLVR